MTWDEVRDDPRRAFDVKLFVGGQLVESRHHHYETDNVNDGATRSFSYSDPLHGAVQVEYTGSRDTIEDVFHRDFTIRAAEPFSVIYVVALEYVLTAEEHTSEKPTYYDYDIVSDDSTRKKFLHSSASYSEDITPMLVGLWNDCGVSNKSNFFGGLQLWLRWPTHMILRDEVSGIIMRGARSNKILRDD